jgi:hypothetical protein
MNHAILVADMIQALDLKIPTTVESPNTLLPIVYMVLLNLTQLLDNVLWSTSTALQAVFFPNQPTGAPSLRMVAKPWCMILQVRLMDKLLGIFFPQLHVPLDGLANMAAISLVPAECPESASNIYGQVEWILVEVVKKTEIEPLLDAIICYKTTLSSLPSFKSVIISVPLVQHHRHISFMCLTVKQRVLLRSLITW